MTQAFTHPARRLHSNTLLFACWGMAIALRAMEDIIQNHQLPCPKPYIEISFLYMILALLSDWGDATQLANMLGAGFLLAFAVRGAQQGASKHTFFGLKY